ncbi:MAG: class I SAM-dependent methyltransferase [Candidatus Saliniplasma sp.]
MEAYKETIEFWDKVFQEDMDFDRDQPISVEEIEDGLKWLAKGSNSMIDFGCGNGKLLLRCSAFGVDRLVGIDISFKAISTAEELARDNDLSEKSFFRTGGISSLSDFEENEFDGGMISNVLDNLLPDDGRRLLKEYNRIIKPGGNVLLKLNDHIDPETLEGWGAEEMSDDFYKEETGLYFWNLTDEDVEKLVSTNFEIQEEVRVEFKEHDQFNRLYYLVNR